jgi:hypothetical protein
VREAVQSPEWNTGDSDTFWDTARPLLLDILSAFSAEEEIVIVIDRLDQCTWTVERGDDQVLNMRTAVEELLHMVAEARCRVKLLLIMDTGSSQKLARLKGAPSRKDRGILLLKPEWCQATDEGRSDG